MAKKSARSKGYRTYKKEVKGFTDKEKKIMIIGFAVLVLIIIAAIAIPNYMENRHLLKMKDGVVQGVGDNWLITNMSNTSKPKYRKIAEVNAAEGYELSETTEGLNDSQERMYYFTPTGEGAAQKYYVMDATGEYDALAADAIQKVSAFSTEVLYSSEVTAEEIDGRQVAYYVLEYTMNTSEVEGEEKLEYVQAVNLYIDSNIDERCVLVSATNSGADDSVFGDRDAMVEVCREAAKAIVLHKD